MYLQQQQSEVARGGGRRSGCSRAALVVATDEHSETVGAFGAQEILRKCAHLLVPEQVISSSSSSSSSDVGSSALIRASHAVEVLGATHGLEVAADEQQLHLPECWSSRRGWLAPLLLAFMLRRFSAAAMVA
jgi:hypothetical protein